MKRIFVLMISLMLLLCAVPSMAQEENSAVLPEWIELSADDTVLTVRIPLEDAQNHTCRFVLSDERVLSLLTCETIGDEAGENGQPMWVGSFMPSFDQLGHVFLQLSVSDSEGNHLSSRMLHLFVREDLSIEIVSFDEDSWFYLTEDSCSLNVSLKSNPTTGFGWICAISDETILQCVSEEYIADPTDEPVSGSGGMWNARFEAVGGAAGFVDLTLSYARSWEENPAAEEHILHFFVNESGMIQPIVPQAVNEAPVGLYEAGDGSTLSIFRRADGTFPAEISIVRLTQQDDGIGVYEDGVLTVTATDASGNPMLWEITRTEAGLKAIVADSTWSLLPEGSEFEFLPLSE